MNSKDGGDSDCVSKIQELVYNGNGSKSKLDRQLSAHAHSTATCPGVPNEIFMADLGKDAIIQYQLEPTIATGGKSAVNLKECGKLGVPLGSGPRSLTFRPSASDEVFSEKGVIGVVSLEIKASLLLVRRRTHDGCLEILQPPVSILPEAWPKDENIAKFNKGRWASDVVWSPCAKFVFAAARLHNSISIFELKHNKNEDGEAEFYLELMERVSTGGKTPRCLCMSPEGDFLLIAHQHSHDITCFQIDKDNGKLTITDKLEHPLAACLKLIPV
jgi:6-phosphogluconolactonase